jgi:hypothetical protein
MALSAAPPSLNSRLIALSQLACVMLFGALLIHRWEASSPILTASFILACASFTASVLYGTYALAIERRVVERTLELDDAQRVLHRMWWLGQQITLELDPRRRGA